MLASFTDMNAECKVHIGTPICQLMVHCLVQDSDKLSGTVLNYFKEKGAKVNGKIVVHHAGLDTKDSKITYGMLDLPLSMKKIDCAKTLVVETGVDLISGGNPDCEKFAIVPMFQEYRDYGTNEFIRWAINEYIPQHPEIDLKLFAQRIIQCIINMNERDKDPKCGWWPPVQRTPAHAILTCHHEKTIKRLIDCGKKNGLDLLDEKSCTGKTALHVAAENGDVESVCILLQL